MKNTGDKVIFSCGATMKNRFMLAPLTNTQSHEDGTLSEEEFHWLTLRAKGQFGLVMTCASHVQANGKGFPGQLGIFGDEHIAGHTKLAKAIQQEGSLAVVQLHHAGMRSPEELIGGQPVSAMDIPRKNARGLSLSEVEKLRDDFVAAAVRAKRCGYDGVEIHGAHGYIVAQFLSAAINQRADKYGGSLENRARLLFEIIDQVRAVCGQEFLLGVRLSPERFGMKLAEMKILCQQLIDGGGIDFLDVSLWDVFKSPEEVEHQEKTLLQHFTELDYKDVKFTVAGKIRNAKDVQTIIDAKVDFVTIGRSAILHHDFPAKVIYDANFEPITLPVTREYLTQEGLSPRFIEYMSRWEGFVDKNT